MRENPDSIADSRIEGAGNLHRFRPQPASLKAGHPLQHLGKDCGSGLSTFSPRKPAKDRYSRNRVRVAQWKTNKLGSHAIRCDRRAIRSNSKVVNSPLPLRGVEIDGDVSNSQRPRHLVQANAAVVDEVPPSQFQFTALGCIDLLKVDEVFEPMATSYHDSPRLGDRDPGQQPEITSRRVHNVNLTSPQQASSLSRRIDGKGELVETRIQVNGKIIETHHGYLVALSAQGIPQLEGRPRRTGV